MKYSEATLEKAINMKLIEIDNTFFANPTTDEEAYRHKISLDKNSNPICGCKWSQINLKKSNKKYCSHALAVLHKINKNRFWEEVEIK